MIVVSGRDTVSPRAPVPARWSSRRAGLAAPAYHGGKVYLTNGLQGSDDGQIVATSRIGQVAGL